MNSYTSNGNPEGAITTAAPPPPPPPPAHSSQLPGLRIEPSGPRKGHQPQFQDAYEPPAAIQNAMMTKDKKPFTYTPGMGGKLDLSQIRSPRMARRVAKNANDEGIEGPPKPSPQSPEAAAAARPPQNPYIHPQVAVPVFPANMPQNPAPLRNAINPTNRPITVIERQEPPRPTVKIPPPHQQPQQSPQPQRVITPVVTVNLANNQPQQSDSPSTPTSPTQVTLAKAPTPWMQNKAIRQPDELPEWAKRRSQDSTPEFANNPAPVYSPQPQQTQQPSPPPRQYVSISPVLNQSRPVPRDNERNVSMRVEERPSVFSVMNDPTGHHQFKNSGPGHHMSRWNNPAPVRQTNNVPQQEPGGGYVIPIQVEGQSQQSHNRSHNSCQSPMSPADNYSMGRNVGRPVANQQPEPGPVQSKAFRVLQRITSTDEDADQLRKLQLTDDDRCLMNKFKEQVDGDGNYLHQEEDPRYRGAAIPSRAFRYLQNMTDSGETSNSNSAAPRAVNSAIKKQNRNSKSFDEGPEVHIVQVRLPASEQQVQEPKKYTGGAIPSRSFKMLQAMTSPESVATQVAQGNHQQDYPYRIESNTLGNQQNMYFLSHPNYSYCDNQNWYYYYPFPMFPHHLNMYYPEHSNPYSVPYNPSFQLNHSDVQRSPSFANYSYSISSCDPSSVDSISSDSNSCISDDSSRTLFLLQNANEDFYTYEYPLSRHSTFYPGAQSNYVTRNRFDEPLAKQSKEWNDDHNTSTEYYSTSQIEVTPLNLQNIQQYENNGLSSEKSSSSEPTCNNHIYEPNNFENVNQETNSNVEICNVNNETDKYNDEENTTVSVSLPLRFKYSISGENKDTMTVTVGDSKITSTKHQAKEFISETSVDFTLKRPTNICKSQMDNSTLKETNTAKEFTNLPMLTRSSIHKASDKQIRPVSCLGCYSQMENGGNHSDDNNIPKKEFLNNNNKDDVNGYENDCKFNSVDVDKVSGENNSENYSKGRFTKYQRTQTHSRLFHLLNDVSLKNNELNPSNKRNEISDELNPIKIDDQLTNLNQKYAPRRCVSRASSEKSFGQQSKLLRPRSLDIENIFPPDFSHVNTNANYKWPNNLQNVSCPRMKHADIAPNSFNSSKFIERSDQFSEYQ